MTYTSHLILCFLSEFPEDSLTTLYSLVLASNPRPAVEETACWQGGSRVTARVAALKT
jgi:hypothetical protein